MGHLSIVFFFWNHQNQESGFEPAESQPNLDIGMVKLRHEELQQVGLSDNDLSMTGNARCHVDQNISNGNDDLGLWWHDLSLAIRRATIVWVDHLGLQFRCENLEYSVLTQCTEQKVDHFCSFGSPTLTRATNEVSNEVQPLFLYSDIILSCPSGRICFCISQGG